MTIDVAATCAGSGAGTRAALRTTDAAARHPGHAASSAPGDGGELRRLLLHSLQALPPDGHGVAPAAAANSGSLWEVRNDSGTSESDALVVLEAAEL